MTEEDNNEVEATVRMPGLFHNMVSLAGVAIVIASIAGILFLVLAEIFGSRSKPYLGIFAYIVFPGFLLLGLLTIAVGMFMERKRRHRFTPSEVTPYPILDLNDPRRRRRFLVFVAMTSLFLFVSAFGSYRAYEYTDSVAFCGQLCHVVMNPQFVAYQVSPHARVRCVECHVGSGAEWYLRSKLSGSYQLYSVLFKKYPKPIPTPVHNLRPANETCEECHWPEKFFGTQLKVFNHFGYDETNTFRQTRMLVDTGGGSAEGGLVSGIHWHMNIANEITYISTDDQRQIIPWVRMKDRNGDLEEYFAEGAQLTSEEIEASDQRKMDCVDCHNRPSHIYNPPDYSVDQSLVSRKLDPSLPYLKRQAVDALSRPYSSTTEALSAIAAAIDEFYRKNYPDIYSSRRNAIDQSVKEIQRIYGTNFFPEMKTDWQAHPNNVAHYYNEGCLRCHDGRHRTKSGKVIRSDCNICHTVLDQSQDGVSIPIENGAFRHPVELGDLARLKCDDCHKGDRGFKHPVNLGDLSQFKCIECHGEKQPKK